MKIAFQISSDGALPYDGVTGEPIIQVLGENIIVIDVAAVPGRAEQGKAWRFDGTGLEQVPNHLGETWYLKATGEAEVIRSIGSPPATLTALVPPKLETGETLAFDNAKKKWVVTPEDAATKAARLEAEAAAKLASDRAAMRLTNTELARALFRAQKISGTEAEDFASSGKVPQTMLNSINAVMAGAGMSESAMTEARILLKGLLVYERTAQLTPVMGLALGMDDLDLDALFCDKVAS